MESTNNYNYKKKMKGCPTQSPAPGCRPEMASRRLALYMLGAVVKAPTVPTLLALHNRRGK